MILPLWYRIIWAAAGLGYVALAGVVAIRRAYLAWPSLLLIAIGEATFCAAGQLLPYRLYLPCYWVFSGILALLRIWLAWDVFRSMPASEYLSTRLRATLICAAIVAAVLCNLVLVHPAAGTPMQELLIYAGQAVTYTWGTVAAVGLWGLAAAGFGFLQTAMMVATGAIIRQISEMADLYVHALGRFSRTAMRTATVADTLIALAVALYWASAIYNETKLLSAYRSARSVQPSHAEESSI